METPEDLQSWGSQYGVKNELYKPSPTQPRCSQRAGTISPWVFPPSSQLHQPRGRGWGWRALCITRTLFGMVYLALSHPGAGSPTG